MLIGLVEYAAFGNALRNMLTRWKRGGFVHRIYAIKLPFCGALRFTMCRLLLGSCIVGTTTLVAMLMPFFNDIMVLIGAFSFWPLAVYFPVEMYIVQANVKKSGVKEGYS